jgi:cation diffusion facilitator family transporter
VSHSYRKIAIGASIFSLVGNLLMAIIKWLAGYFGNSYALIADAIESTGDILASTLVLIGLRYTYRPADDDHPYGHGRIEPIITFVVVMFMAVSAFIIAYESIVNILHPHEKPKVFTIYVLVPIIIWKEISFQIVNRRAIKTNSTSLKADAWHHRSDAITSVAALIGISIALYFGDGYESADDIAALFASGFIFFNAYKIFRPAFGEMMDENYHSELIQEIRVLVSKVKGVVDSEKCFIRKTGTHYQVDLHVVVNGNLSVREGHTIAHNVKDKLLQENPNISYVLVHIEPASKEL